MQRNLWRILNFFDPYEQCGNVAWNNTNRDLKIEFLDISRESRTSRSHVTRGLVVRSAFTVYLFTVIYGKVFFTLKHHNPTFEKKDDFLELLLIDYRILLIKKRNFEVNFSAKIEVSGGMKTNMAASSYHPWILNPKYGQTGNEKPLTAVCSKMTKTRILRCLISNLKPRFVV